jgi:hypothetical protein
MNARHKVSQPEAQHTRQKRSDTFSSYGKSFPCASSTQTLTLVHLDRNRIQSHHYAIRFENFFLKIKSFCRHQFGRQMADAVWMWKFDYRNQLNCQTFYCNFIFWSAKRGAVLIGKTLVSSHRRRERAASFELFAIAEQRFSSVSLYRRCCCCHSARLTLMHLNANGQSGEQQLQTTRRKEPSRAE